MKGNFFSSGIPATKRILQAEFAKELEKDTASLVGSRFRSLCRAATTHGRFRRVQHCAKEKELHIIGVVDTEPRPASAVTVTAVC